jgi:hypothetical protein
VLDGAKEFALKACDGRRVEVGDTEKVEAETEGDLKPMSLQSLLAVLKGVTGEAIDLEVVGLEIWSIDSAGEGTTVEKEDIDSGFEDIEPC